MQPDSKLGRAVACPECKGAGSMPMYQDGKRVGVETCGCCDGRQYVAEAHGMDEEQVKSLVRVAARVTDMAETQMQAEREAIACAVETQSENSLTRREWNRLLAERIRTGCFAPKVKP